VAGGDARPFEDLYAGLASPRAGAASALATLERSPHYARALRYFETRPTRSLMAPVGCALLYHLTRLLGAKAVLEIGTYRAGGTEAIAMAIAAEGGIVITLDPNGQRDALVRETIAAWPEPMRAATQYHNHSSATFFDQLELGQLLAFDLIVVDGYHEYGYALFDMTMAAKYARPGAIMIVDDFVLPEVFWAARDFASAHPDWTVVGDVFARVDPDRPFETQRPSLPGTNFVIFVAPLAMELGPRPKVVHYPALEISGIRGLDFGFAPGNPAGALHALAILRASAPLPALPEQLHRHLGMVVVPGVSSQLLLIDPPLRTDRNIDRSLELQLIFRPTDGDARLVLAGPPELLPAP
jgi:predicted O-methyltransferase YrrM